MWFTVSIACNVNGSIRSPGERVETTENEARRLERSFHLIRDENEWPVYEAEPVKAIHDVMVFTPVYRLEPETVTAVLALQWGGPITWIFQRDNPGGGGGNGDHLHQYQRARDVFLSGSYEAMLVIESDIIPPPDTLKKLAALNSDVAYGVYRFRVSNVINIFERYPGTSRNMGESLTIHPHKLRRAVHVGTTPCSGAGLGCTLIRRNVLEALPFRLEENTAHCDTWFNIDVLRGGFSQWADMSVVCGHKDEKGEILWPVLS